MRLSTGSAGNEYNSDEDDDEEEDEAGDSGGGAEGGEKEEEACMIVLALNGAGGGGVGGGGEEAGGAAGAAGAPAEAALLSSWNPSSAANSVMTRAASFASGSAGGGGGGIGEVLVLRASSLAERTVWVERLNTTIEGLRGQNASSSFTRSFKGGLGGSGGIAASAGGGGGDLLSRGVLMEGNIRKKRAASARQTWDRRYAVLSANTLVYADKKAHLTSNDKSRHIDLSRFSLRVNVGEDGASQVLELYCPFERAYHLKADSDGLTLAWAEAIRSEQGRIARILVERHKIDAVATTRSAAAAVGGSATPSSSTPAAAMSGGGGGGGGAAVGAPGSELPLRENSFPPPLPSERWLRQQGLLKYGWVDQRVISDTTGSYDASGGGAGGGGGGGDGGKGDGRWRRQWLVLREDGLLLFYRKAKDTQPVKVLFAHEFNATKASGVAAAAQPPPSPQQNNDQPSSRQYAIQISPVAYSDETEILLLDPQVRRKQQHMHSIPLPPPTTPPCHAHNSHPPLFTSLLPFLNRPR